MSASALGRPYDDSRNQPLPGLPAPPDLEARMAAVDRAPENARAEPEGNFTLRPGGGGGDVENYGMPEPLDAVELPTPNEPMAVGREIVRRARLAGHLPYRFWRGEFYRYTGSHWELTNKTIINKWLYLTTENAWYLAERKGVMEPKNWAPDRRKIGNLAHALSDGLLTHDGEEDRCIALANGVYNLKTGRLDPHDEQRFNLTVLPFAYDQHATCPRWLQFLDEVLPGDPEARDFLAEWFGYVISGRTDQQKMLSLVGHKRCGKGTIARVLHALLGASAVAAPTINQLGARFGEQPLIGKKLAVMSDVRWNNGPVVAEAVPILLAIIGEDPRDVERKNRENWHGYLGVRFMMMSNEPPNFRDTSGALAYRMMQVQFTQSFVGSEDTGLTDTLLTELPGILNWALDGLKRFAQRGKFVQPASSEALAAEVRRLASPYQAFLEDFCELDPAARTAVPDLLRAYGQWARREGRTQDQQTTSSLSRGLRTTDGRITVTGRSTLPNGQRVTMLGGVKLTVAPQWVVEDEAAEHALYEQAELDVGADR